MIALRNINTHGGRRRHERRADLRGLPVLRSKNTPPGPCSADHPHHMAVRRVGTRPHWSAKEGAGGLHPLAGSGRQILQMDRGSTHRQDQIRASGSILHRHRLQGRGPVIAIN